MKKKMEQTIMTTKVCLRRSENNRKELITLNYLQNKKNRYKNTQKIINELISNTENKLKDLPEKSVINNSTILEKQETAENLNKYFANIGPNLTSKILNKQGSFEKNLPNCKNTEWCTIKLKKN